MRGELRWQQGIAFPQILVREHQPQLPATYVPVTGECEHPRSRLMAWRALRPPRLQPPPTDSRLLPEDRTLGAHGLARLSNWTGLPAGWLCTSDGPGDHGTGAPWPLLPGLPSGRRRGRGPSRNLASSFELQAARWRLVSRRWKSRAGWEVHCGAPGAGEGDVRGGAMPPRDVVPREEPRTPGSHGGCVKPPALKLLRD